MSIKTFQQIKLIMFKTFFSIEILLERDVVVVVDSGARHDNGVQRMAECFLSQISAFIIMYLFRYSCAQSSQAAAHYSNGKRFENVNNGSMVGKQFS